MTRAPVLSDRPQEGELAELLPYYRTMLLSVMTWIADRYEQHPEYPFIDTKVDLMTGRDFPDGDPVRDRSAVYAYIQGRGLEALAGHCRWFRRRVPEAEPLVSRLERAMREVLASLRRMRSVNGGHLSFFMTPDGLPFRLDEAGRRQSFPLDASSPYTLSDLFCAKGMYAAADYLGDAEARAEALAYCRAVVDAVRRGTLAHDQQPLDPKNPVGPVPGRHSQGPYMLSLGLAALLVQGEGGAEPVRFGLELLCHVFARHINLGENLKAGHPFAEADFWEFVDDEGRPYRKDGAVPSDPGHALEFVGLGLKFAAVAGATGAAGAPGAGATGAPDEASRRELDAYVSQMQAVLERNFANGFQPGPAGICKSFDLVSRRPLNSDMPWWNLPETMRAAAYCAHFARDAAARGRALAILARCHNAFAGHYVRPDFHYTAYQTRDAGGRPVNVIPATADADPGYHTGLSIIDMLELLFYSSST